MIPVEPKYTLTLNKFTTLLVAGPSPKSTAKLVACHQQGSVFKVVRPSGDSNRCGGRDETLFCPPADDRNV